MGEYSLITSFIWLKAFGYNYKCCCGIGEWKKSWRTKEKKRHDTLHSMKKEMHVHVYMQLLLRGKQG